MIELCSYILIRLPPICICGSQMFKRVVYVNLTAVGAKANHLKLVILELPFNKKTTCYIASGFVVLTNMRQA